VLAAPYQAFPTKDGWINIGGANQANWERIATVVGLPKLIADPRFATNADRMAHKQALAELIAARTKTRSSADWVRQLEASGVPVGPINKIGQMLADPQVAAREMVVEVDHPTAGRTKALGLPIKFSATPGSVRSAAPLLGQHTRAVLLSLGYSDKEIRALEKSGAVVCAAGA
jgi:crotonobetainyl-CoA:carnitine CoA-transferase CaiB-like acyl-CoA transferase